MDEHRQHLVERHQIVAKGELRAHLAEHDGIDGFEMRRVRDQAHMDLDPVELAVGRGAEMVFHVARSADILGIGGAARELVEDDAEALGQHIGEHVEAAAMGHAIDDLAHARLAAIFDDGFERGNHRFAAVQAEALGADILRPRNFSYCSAWMTLVRIAFLPSGVKVISLSLPSIRSCRKRPLLDVGDVHIFHADIAAVIGAQHLDEFAHRRPFETERAGDIDLPVERGAAEAMIFRVRSAGRS